MRTLGKRVGRVIGLGGSNPPGSASHQKTGKGSCSRNEQVAVWKGKQIG